MWISAYSQCYNAPNTLLLDIHHWFTAVVMWIICLVTSVVLYTKVCRVLWAPDKTIFKRGASV